MQLKTQTIIQTLPFEKSFKDDLLSRFDSLSNDQKFDITQLVWETYYALYQLKLEENLDLAYENALEGKGKFDKEFYKRVSEETRQQMHQGVSETAEDAALTDTRQKLQEILNQAPTSSDTSN